MPERYYSQSIKLHEDNKGKLEICSKVPLRTMDDLSRAYTPGVAEVCRRIARDKNLAYRYTMKSNSVAVVTDGSAVLGLGNIGGTASIPVMEGKSILLKRFANIDAFPICFDNIHPDFIDDIKSIAPVFGAILLEDIAAPKCFEVEEALQDMGIPVMHDDQHGTAVVVLAALLNACRVVKKNLEDLTVVVSGAGAAGFAITKLLHCLGVDRKICTEVKELFVCDRKGIIYRGREDLLENKYKYIISQETNHEKRTGSLSDAMEGADVFIGVSGPNLVTEKMIESMAEKPIVMPLANPVPEIMPDRALKAGAAVVGTGRSDFPNQINNVLAFPGIFRGALDAWATVINNEMKMSAAHALAGHVKRPKADKVLPHVLERSYTRTVAEAVRKAAIESGVSRRK
jgi:malate dehydrogenase (oxaloacetate-decarboxylating)